MSLEFGSGAQWSADPVVLVNQQAASQIRLRGPKAKALTFEPVICRTCNDTRSQPFDTAAIALGRYIKAHESQVLATRQLIWDEVDQGRDGETTRLNFIRYMIKFVGCNLATQGLDIPMSFLEVLEGRQRVAPELHLTMSIRADIVDFLRYEEERTGQSVGAIWSGGVTVEPESESEAGSVYGHYTSRFLRTNWTILDHRSDGGAEFDSDVVALEERRNVQPSDYPWNQTSEQ